MLHDAIESKPRPAALMVWILPASLHAAVADKNGERGSAANIKE
jgi:hypothetical protein